jgi:hypothetical protein
MKSTFATRIDPKQFNFSPKMTALVGAIIGHDYGVRDGRGNQVSSFSITSDGFLVSSSNAFLGDATDLHRNLVELKKFLSAADVTRLDRLYKERIQDWRSL